MKTFDMCMKTIFLSFLIGVTTGKICLDEKLNINVTASLTVRPKEPNIQRNTDLKLNITLIGHLNRCTTFTMKSSPDNITTIPDPFTVCENDIINSVFSIEIFLETLNEGKVVLEFVTKNRAVDTSDAFVSLSVMVTPAINTASDVIGWIYTIAWDASFLPQIWHNYKRQSVIGLSFDFLTYNFLGFFCYFIFNMGLLWIDPIQDQYYVQNPYEILHVRINDVIFPLYALICTAFQIGQCFIYERGNQRVSTTCRVISSCLIASAIIMAIHVAAVETYLWLNFLYYLSYIKLAITCIKYTPQLYANYKLKSTEGWSIWQVILDFTGGTFSLLQMFLLAANYDDYNSVLTDPTKLGLGLMSILFNILFFIQHYFIYRNAKPISSVESGDAVAMTEKTK